MKLPNAEHAIVEERKLRDYVLSRIHPIGRFKAGFFASLGFSAENWADLASELKSLALEGQASPAPPTSYGQKFVVFGTLIGTSGQSADVVTVWIVLKDDDTPRLVTVYPR